MSDLAQHKGYKSIVRPEPVREMLAEVGQRVELIRAQRAMTRKRLAELSGVSLAYLARLEAGKGNISLQLLMQVAAALGVSMEALVAEDSEVSVDQLLLQEFIRQLPADRLAQVRKQLMQTGDQLAIKRSRCIALIGLRGVGKTTLGMLLAKELGRPFVELDKEIENEMGLEIREIFEHLGQSEFRRAERQCLDLLIQSKKPMVLAPAGGIVTELRTYSLLLSSCITVYLKASPEQHILRVQRQKDDRLSAPEVRGEAMEVVWNTLKAREDLYQRADIVLDTTHQTAEQALRELKARLAKLVGQLGEVLD